MEGKDCEKNGRSRKQEMNEEKKEESRKKEKKQEKQGPMKKIVIPKDQRGEEIKIKKQND